MCSASARALPAGALGWRAARDVTAARAPGRGGGEARAAGPAACVLGPVLRAVRAPRRPALCPLLPSAGYPSSPGHRALEGGVQARRAWATAGPERAGEGALRMGMGS